MIDRCRVHRVRVLAKCRCYKAADKKSFDLSSVTQGHAGIAIVVSKSFQKSFSNAFQTLYPAHVADKILSVIPFDLLPFLTGKVVAFIQLSHLLI